MGGVDVKNMDFDSIIDTISSMPQDEPVDCVFIDPAKVMKGPAIIDVKLPTTFDASTGEPIEKTIQIQAMKGQTMRRVLLDSGVDLYDMKGKATNCGGAGQCGTCVVKMTIPDDDWTPMPSFEKKSLKKYDADCRLSCMVIIEGDCSVKIRPPPVTDSKV